MAIRGIIILLICRNIEKRTMAATRNEIGRGGVITNPLVHKRICNEIKNWLSEQ